jgi:hypothetical protein
VTLRATRRAAAVSPSPWSYILADSARCFCDLVPALRSHRILLRLDLAAGGSSSVDAEVLGGEALLRALLAHVPAGRAPCDAASPAVQPPTKRLRLDSTSVR